MKKNLVKFALISSIAIFAAGSFAASPNKDAK